MYSSKDPHVASNAEVVLDLSTALGWRARAGGDVVGVWTRYINIDVAM